MFGLAKKKMFGTSTSKWPQLAKLVDQGILLNIDIAYAETQVQNGDEKEIGHHAALLALARQGHLFVDKNCIEDPLLSSLILKNDALSKYAQLEEEIAFNIARLLKQNIRQEIPILSSDLTIEQSRAIQNALDFPLSVITGGPGSGKTFTAAQIAKMFQTQVLLMAPTGKAAAQLQGKCNPSASCGTLHSFLKIRSPLDCLKEAPLLEAKLIIVDECSMIDPLLFSYLLKSIPQNVRLILMGDANQLSAIEGGNVFADLIASKKIPTTVLTKCMRCDRSEILDLATAILRGETKDLRTIDLGMGQNDIEKFYQNLWGHVQFCDFNTFKILTPLRKGPFGTEKLNEFLFAKFSFVTDCFPIMVTRNDERTGLYNGDMGVLKKNGKAYFSNERQFSIEELPCYEYAYCISVHKSQGSEFDHVLFLIPEGSEAFGKEVLYTGVTRAKSRLEIDGNPIQIELALRRSSKKSSKISEKINKYI